MSETIRALSATIEDRRVHPREGSYTASLFQAGRGEILKKVGEEATEVVVAGALEDDGRVLYEAADLVYTRNLGVLTACLARGLPTAFEHYRPWGDQFPPLHP